MEQENLKQRAMNIFIFGAFTLFLLVISDILLDWGFNRHTTFPHVYDFI